MTGRFLPAAGVAAATAGAGAYWVRMSPWSQHLGPFPYAACTAERVVALTFDDGPNEPHTTAIADHLASREVRATFFQVGECVERWPDTTRRLVAAGHLIGNHSWSHQLSRCLRLDVMAEEIQRTQTLLTEVAGRAPTLYRPPWLLRSRGLFPLLSSEGLTARSGEFCHAFEPLQPPSAWIARRALAKVRPGAVLIFHDGWDARGGDRASTVAAVRLVVDRLADDGWRFATLAEAPYAQHRRVEA